MARKNRHYWQRFKKDLTKRFQEGARERGLFSDPKHYNQDLALMRRFGQLSDCDDREDLLRTLLLDPRTDPMIALKAVDVLIADNAVRIRARK